MADDPVDPDSPVLDSDLVLRFWALASSQRRDSVVGILAKQKGLPHPSPAERLVLAEFVSLVQ